MLRRRSFSLSTFLRCGGAVAAFVFAAYGAAGAQAAAAGPYAPYAFLIGAWNVTAEGGGPPVAGAQFRWGPNRSYIWYAGSIVAGGEKRPHFEGMLMWNGVSKKLDMLLAMDLEHGLAQEHGTMSVEADGTVVREISAAFSEGVRAIGQPVAGPGGATARFRQTFKLVAPDRVLTTVMRESGPGWVPTFPGSDHLVMTRS
jgi:hypothetical protein